MSTEQRLHSDSLSAHSNRRGACNQHSTTLTLVKPFPTTTTTAMAFGSFEEICGNVALPLCALVGPYSGTGRPGIEPVCYSRTIEAANTIIFEAASGFVHIGALIMCLIMVFHVRSKFTAVGALHELFWCRGRDGGGGGSAGWEGRG